MHVKGKVDAFPWQEAGTVGYKFFLGKLHLCQSFEKSLFLWKWFLLFQGLGSFKICINKQN